MSAVAVEASPFAGAGLLDSAHQIYQGVQSRDWAQIALGQVGAGLDGISLSIDPVGTMAAWGFTRGFVWLDENVQVLHEAVDWLVGDAEQFLQHELIWREVAAALRGEHAVLGDAAQRLMTEWVDDVGAQARGHVQEHEESIAAAAQAAETVGAILVGTGLVLVTARSLVGELIGQFLSSLAKQLLRWIATAAVSKSRAAPAVVAEVRALVARCATKIDELFKLVASSLQNLGRYAEQLRELFARIRGAVPKVDDSALASRAPDAVRATAITVDRPDSTFSRYHSDPDAPSSDPDAVASDPIFPPAEPDLATISGGRSVEANRQAMTVHGRHGFSGVYDPESGKIHMELSGGPDARVDRLSGHGEINDRVFDDAWNTVGFVAVMIDDAIQVKWNSTSVNTMHFANRAAPEQYRAAIMDAIRKVTGLEVTE